MDSIFTLVLIQAASINFYTNRPLMLAFFNRRQTASSHSSGRGNKKSRPERDGILGRWYAVEYIYCLLLMSYI